MPSDTLWLLLLLVLALACLLYPVWQHLPSPLEPTVVKARVARPLKPRTPAECPACQQEASTTRDPPLSSPVRPWRDIKSRRGARVVRKIHLWCAFDIVLQPHLVE